MLEPKWMSETFVAKHRGWLYNLSITSESVTLRLILIVKVILRKKKKKEIIKETVVNKKEKLQSMNNKLMSKWSPYQLKMRNTFKTNQVSSRAFKSQEGYMWKGRECRFVLMEVE